MATLKRIIVIAELCAILVLLILTVSFGFNRGVWDGEEFFLAVLDGNTSIYEGRNASSVEIVSKEAPNKIIIRTADGSAAQLSFEVKVNGDLKTVTLFAADGTVLINDRYYSNAKKWGSTKNNDAAISKHFTSTEGFHIGLFDKGLLDMALGNTQTRLSGRIGAFLYAALFLALGFVINFSIGLIEKLDRLFAGIFYDNAKSLHMNELGELCYLILGCVIFVMGVVLLAKGVLFV